MITVKDIMSDADVAKLVNISVDRFQRRMRDGFKSGEYDFRQARPTLMGGRKAWTPPEANTDRAQMMAKWGTRAKALFAATPKKVAAGTSAQAATKPAQAAPAAGGGVAPSRRAAAPAAPSRPAGGAQKKADPWTGYEKSCNGAFEYFCSLLGEPYSGPKHDEKWFELFDAAAVGKDPDEFTQMDIERLFLTIRDGMAK